MRIVLLPEGEGFEDELETCIQEHTRLAAGSAGRVIQASRWAVAVGGTRQGNETQGKRLRTSAFGMRIRQGCCSRSAVVVTQSLRHRACRPRASPPSVGVPVREQGDHATVSRLW